jgi:hypothetical protein
MRVSYGIHGSAANGERQAAALRSHVTVCPRDSRIRSAHAGTQAHTLVSKPDAGGSRNVQRLLTAVVPEAFVCDGHVVGI